MAGFLAALGPLLAKGGAALGKGASALKGGAGGALSFLKSHPNLSRGIMGGIMGGISGGQTNPMMQQLALLEALKNSRMAQVGDNDVS